MRCVNKCFCVKYYGIALPWLVVWDKRVLSSILLVFYECKTFLFVNRVPYLSCVFWHRFIQRLENTTLIFVLTCVVRLHYISYTPCLLSIGLSMHWISLKTCVRRRRCYCHPQKLYWLYLASYSVYACSPSALGTLYSHLNDVNVGGHNALVKVHNVHTTRVILWHCSGSGKKSFMFLSIYLFK